MNDVWVFVAIFAIGCVFAYKMAEQDSQDREASRKRRRKARKQMHKRMNDLREKVKREQDRWLE